MALVSGALRPLRGRGPVCLSVVLESVREQDIALPLYMKRIHHLSLHRMNYVQSVPGKQSREKLESRRENLQRFYVGLKIQLLWVEEILCGLLFFKAFDNNFKHCQLRPTFTIITDARCAARLCSSPQNFMSVPEKIPKFPEMLNLSGRIWGNVNRLIL